MKESTMFFFGAKKDKYYDVAQKLFAALAEAVPDDWKEDILMQRDLMKKAKLCNLDSALALFFKRLPEEARPMVSVNDEVPFASVRLKKAEKEFFADFHIGPDGTICAIQFTFFPKDCVFDVSGVDFYPEIMKNDVRPPERKTAFRISEKLVSILGPEWDREFAPPKADLEENDDDSAEFLPALPPEQRHAWQHAIHAELTDDWREFSESFFQLHYHGAVVYGCGEEMQLIPMHPGDTAMYLVARIENEASSINESYLLASADPAKQHTLYYLAEYDGGESDAIPIGTDLFGFLRKAKDQVFLKSLMKN
jgi:hypothetical protein